MALGQYSGKLCQHLLRKAILLCEFATNGNLAICNLVIETGLIPGCFCGSVVDGVGSIVGNSVSNSLVIRSLIDLGFVDHGRESRTAVALGVLLDGGLLGGGRDAASDAGSAVRALPLGSSLLGTVGSVMTGLPLGGSFLAAFRRSDVLAVLDRATLRRFAVLPRVVHPSHRSTRQARFLLISGSRSTALLLAPQVLGPVLIGDVGAPVDLDLANVELVKVADGAALVGGPGVLEPVRVVHAPGDVGDVLLGVVAEGVVVDQRADVGAGVGRLCLQDVRVRGHEGEDLALVLGAENVPGNGLEEEGLEVLVSKRVAPRYVGYDIWDVGLTRKSTSAVTRGDFEF